MDVDKEPTPGSLDDFFPNRESCSTVNVSGGTGGAGGNGLLIGGVGGNAEAPRLYMTQTNAERFTVNMNGTEQALINGNYRKIAWGDVYLQDQQYVMDPIPQSYCQSSWQQPRYSVRRVHAAKINGQNLTVATYKGNRAEQIYGIIQCKDVYAAIFHDNYMPFDHLLTHFRNSVLLTTYIYIYYYQQHHVGATSMANSFVDILAEGSRLSDDGSANTSLLGKVLPWDNFHDICHEDARYEYLAVSSAVMHLDSVYTIDTSGNSIEIATSESDSDPDFDWRDGWHGGWKHASEWTHLDTACRNIRFTFTFHAVRSTDYPQTETIPYAWLSQANYIFKRLGVKSNFSNYVLPYEIELKICLKHNTRNANRFPKGYLWLRSASYFSRGHSFKGAKSLAYWSLDPYGIEELSTDDAFKLGFPIICMEKIVVHGRSWDDRVYADIRKIHQAKGFDPDSQDVARSLGFPLYKPCLNVEEEIVTANHFRDTHAEDTEEKSGREHEPGLASDEKELRSSKDSSNSDSKPGDFDQEPFLHLLQDEAQDQMPASKAFKVVTAVQLLLIFLLGVLALVDIKWTQQRERGDLVKIFFSDSGSQERGVDENVFCFLDAQQRVESERLSRMEAALGIEVPPHRPVVARKTYLEAVSGTWKYFAYWSVPPHQEV
ncbi:hypothetical protein R3P38DRAFT_2799737 [Favolaschia claudopus]|uniref:Uncharacterized protein n=1 Tax=Favolaschia claudopus TaxID=2862362 RepID=A0AAV9ZYS9_9AGAR